MTAETNSMPMGRYHRAPMSRAAFACLLAGGVCIAFAPIFVRLSDTGPLASAFWRVALAIPVVWAWAALSGAPRREKAPAGRTHFRYLFLAGLFFALDLGVWHWSIVWTSVANATLLANLAPIVVTLAHELKVDSRPFVMAVTVAASTAFALPMGYQTHMMVFGPGGYKFVDFLKVGIPLNIICWIIACTLIPFIWPF